MPLKCTLPWRKELPPLPSLNCLMFHCFLQEEGVKRDKWMFLLIHEIQEDVNFGRGKTPSLNFQEICYVLACALISCGRVRSERQRDAMIWDLILIRGKFVMKYLKTIKRTLLYRCLINKPGSFISTSFYDRCVIENLLSPIKKRIWVTFLLFTLSCFMEGTQI